MSDWQQHTLSDYRAKGFAERSGFGARPVLLIVDFINGFTDPTSPLGGDFSTQLAVTARLQEQFRRCNLPVFYTTIAYRPDFRDAGLFIKKVPSLGLLVQGSRASQVDSRIQPRFDETVVRKNFASAFFDTDLDGDLRRQGVDTVVMTGCTTSGCIRASAVDSMQYGFHTVVVSDGVGDRAPGPHEANLFDIDAKYGDVVTEQRVHEYLATVDTAATPADIHPRRDAGEFQRWWNSAAESADS